SLRVEADREQLGRADPGPAPQLRGFRLRGQGVKIDYAIEGIVGVLHGDPVAQRSDVVAEVERVGSGLNTGKYSETGHGRILPRAVRALPADLVGATSADRPLCHVESRPRRNCSVRPRGAMNSEGSDGSRPGQRSISSIVTVAVSPTFSF